MRSPRNTEAQKRQEWDEAERRVWDEFRQRMAVLSDFLEAKRLVLEGPGPDRPGRRFYSNLAFFLGEFRIPGGARDDELALYLGFIQRIDKAGQLKPGAGLAVEAALKKALRRD